MSVRWLAGEAGCDLVGSSAALPFSLPYLASRLPGVVLEGTGIVSFAAFRGMMDTLTPLQVSLAANLINVALDPLLIFISRESKNDQFELVQTLIHFCC